MFQDEARFGRIADTRRCWCPAPQRPLCQAMITREYTYAYAAVSVPDGALDSLILPHLNTECMQVFVDELARRYATERVLMVLDGAGWYRSGELRWPVNIRPLPLPPYSPELNPVEHLWDEIREKSFHNRVFDCLDALRHTLRLFDVDDRMEAQGLALLCKCFSLCIDVGFRVLLFLVLITYFINST